MPPAVSYFISPHAARKNTLYRRILLQYRGPSLSRPAPGQLLRNVNDPAASGTADQVAEAHWVGQ